MVPYNKSKQPGISQWTSGTGATMNAVVQLDNSGGTSFTNLDEVTGRVIVRCTKSVDVTSIVVKLEGESRTKLLSPANGNERPRPQLEYHKILYRVQMVFPPPGVAEERVTVGGSSYTLPVGQHEYPFRFKLPFNNACTTDTSMIPSVSVSNSGIGFARPPSQHVKKTLPPTISGFPGEAEIRYFVKATVSRHSIFKENPRAYAPCTFIPIEPPRPAPTGSEIYARQRHIFTEITESDSTKGKAKAFFGGKSASATPVGEGPHVSIDARLPEPAILTCNSTIPVRILVKKHNDFSGSLYLQSLQIILVAQTKVRAHEVFRTETTSWMIVSKSNMGVEIGRSEDAIGTETELDSGLWREQGIPNTVAPSFETCNISRSYHIDIRVGLCYTGKTRNLEKVWKPIVPQNIVLPFRLDTMIYSGIEPPAQLLERMAETRTEKRPYVDPPTHAAAGGSTSTGVPLPPGNTPDELPPMYSEAPPSYEDAVAIDLAPVDAPRPDYAPPAVTEDNALRRDEKSGW